MDIEDTITSVALANGPGVPSANNTPLDGLVDTAALDDTHVKAATDLHSEASGSAKDEAGVGVDLVTACTAAIHPSARLGARTGLATSAATLLIKVSDFPVAPASSSGGVSQLDFTVAASSVASTTGSPDPGSAD